MWETGTFSPSAEFLALIAGLGGDVTYIVTGNRPVDVELPPREKALIDNYRNADADGKKALERTAIALAEHAACYEIHKKAEGE